MKRKWLVIIAVFTIAGLSIISLQTEVRGSSTSHTANVILQQATPAALTTVGGKMIPSLRATPQTTRTTEGAATKQATAVSTLAISSTNTITSTSAESIVTLKSADELSSQLMYELSYVSGGAQGDLHYGQGNCAQVNNGTASLRISGVYSTKERYKTVPFGGDKNTICKEHIVLGDMVYLVASGFKDNDEIQFILKTPNGISRYKTRAVWTQIEGSSWGLESYTGARFSFVASPEMGTGQYTLTIVYATGDLSIDFDVKMSNKANFGAQFNRFGHPLMLSDGEDVELVYTGFPGGHVVTTLMYEDPGSVTDLNVPSNFVGYVSRIIGFFEVKMDTDGNASIKLSLPHRSQVKVVEEKTNRKGPGENCAKRQQGLGCRDGKESKFGSTYSFKSGCSQSKAAGGSAG